MELEGTSFMEAANASASASSSLWVKGSRSM